jgi:hypothetical protein
MRRLVWFLLCAILGLGMFICGLLVPAHLRAVDESVLQRAGQETTSLINQGLVLAGENKLGAAQLMLKAADQEKLPGREKLEYAVSTLARQHPRWEVWGGPEPRFESIFEPDKRLPDSGSQSFTDYLIRQPNRDRVLALLTTSGRLVVQQLLQFRNITNTVLFPSSSSSSGQALDAAISIVGLLADAQLLTPVFSNTVFTLAINANLGGNTQPLENVLLDLMSLGQRFNWGQLVVFVGEVQDAETLRLLVNLIRKEESQVPIVFSAVELSKKPGAVARYLVEFGQTGFQDLGAALRFGTGGLNELLARNQRFYVSPWQQSVALECCWQMPWLALAVKWLAYMAAGFLLAAALHFARPAVSELEEPLQVRGFHVAREFLFAIGFLLVVLLVTEPFLSQESQRIDFPFRVRLPTVGSILPTVEINNRVNTSFMNKLSLLTLLLFFVLQALLYTASLVKLAEIRRQRVPPHVRLRLLENEDHLFDAGLYLGFVGTIISLILVSLGVIKPSLMAAYSSTSFGIIFVSIFKIFHLRPVRRRLVLEAEAESPQTISPGAAARLVTP